MASLNRLSGVTMNAKDTLNPVFLEVYLTDGERRFCYERLYGKQQSFLEYFQNSSKLAFGLYVRGMQGKIQKQIHVKFVFYASGPFLAIIPEM